MSKIIDEEEQLNKIHDKLHDQLTRKLKKYQHPFECEFDDEFLALRKKFGESIKALHEFHQKHTNEELSIEFKKKLQAEEIEFMKKYHNN